MKKTKRLLSLLMAVSFCLSLLPFTLSAVNATFSGLTYLISNGEVAITGCASDLSGSLTIPGTIDGYPVTSIEWYAFSNCNSLTSVTIPDSVTSINSRAFYNCTSLEYNIFNGGKYLGSQSNPYDILMDTTSDDILSFEVHPDTRLLAEEVFSYNNNLTSVTIPDSVIIIGDEAFYCCCMLECVMIPDSVASIGEKAFAGCDGLGGFVVATNNPYYSNDDRGVLFNKDKTVLIQAHGSIFESYVIPDGVTSIGDDAFYSCDGLSSVTIPDSVTSIGWGAFSYCCSLTDVTLSACLTDIGRYAFSYCENLRSITIPDGVTSIGEDMFFGCYSLSSITIPDSVTSIGSLAFYMCRSLTGVTIPDGITSIEYASFYGCKSLSAVTLPNSVTSIEDGAFGGCTSLTDVTIPDSVSSIGVYAFSNCTSLTDVEIPDSVTGINERVFSGCSSLTDVTIPDSVTYIDVYAFSGCTSLTDVTIPNSVNVIRERAFSNCSSLEDVYFVGDAPVFLTEPFENCSSNLRVHYHTGTAGWESVTSEKLTESSDGAKLIESAHICPLYTYDNNHTCTTDGTKSGQCLRCGITETVTVPGTASGHAYTAYISDQNATCTTDGTKTAKCDHCDATDVQIDIGSMAHRYYEGYCVYCGEGEVNLASICGSVTAFGQGAIVLELVSESGDVISRFVSDSTYRLEEMKPGNYTLTVSQTGSVTRSYSLTLDGGEHTQDLKLHLPGDINGDGRYNIGDVARIYAHVKSSTPLTGYELLCADYTGDGRVNVGDTARVYYILKGN